MAISFEVDRTLEAELAHWVTICRRSAPEAEELNTLEQWLAVDERRRLHLRQRLAQANTAPPPEVSAAEERADASVWEPLRRHAVLPSAWYGMLRARRLLLLFGMPSPPLPRVQEITSYEILDYENELGQRARQLRLQSTADALTWQRYEGAPGQITVQTDRWLNWIHLAPHSVIDVRYGLDHRELRLVRGEVHLRLLTLAGWDCRLQIDDLCLRGRDANIVLRRHEQNCVELFVINGLLTASRSAESCSIGELRPELLGPNNYALFYLDNLKGHHDSESGKTLLEERAPKAFFFVEPTPYTKGLKREPPLQSLPPLPAPHDLTAVEINRCEEWAARLDQDVVQPRVLCELRTWLDADEVYLLLVRKLLFERQARRSSQSAPVDLTPEEFTQLNERFEPRRRHEAVLHHWVARFKLGWVRFFAFALLDEVQRRDFSYDALTRIYPRFEAKPLLYVEFKRLTGMWRTLLTQHKRLLFDGYSVNDLPDFTRITPGRLAQLYRANTDSAVGWRRLHYSWVPPFELTNESGEVLHQQLPGDDELALKAQSAVRVCYLPQQRHIQLLRGEFFIEAQTQLNWPLEVLVGQLCIRTDDALFGVHQDGQGLQVYVNFGALCITVAPGMSSPALKPNQCIWIKPKQWLCIKGDRVELYDIDLDTYVRISGWRTQNTAKYLENSALEA